MKCPSCHTEVVGLSCATCGRVMDSNDATGTLSADAIAELSTTDAVLASIPAGVSALVVVRGPNAGEVWPLNNDVVEVGRSADSGLFLDDITVSRKHAIFKKTPGGWTLEDCGSLNGSYVNRELITNAVELHDEDEIQLGKFRFSFHGAR